MDAPGGSNGVGIGLHWNREKCKQSVSENLACSEHAADLVAVLEAGARRSKSWASRARDDSSCCNSAECCSMESSVIISRQLSFPVETPPIPATSEGRRGGRTRSQAHSATPLPLAAPAAEFGAHTQANGTYLPAPMSMLLTVRDVAVALRLGRTRTYALLRSGEIPVIRVGRAVRVPRDGLHRWIEEHCTSVDQASSGNGFESR
jgi:excisionase family DNA binding protein